MKHFLPLLDQQDYEAVYSILPAHLPGSYSEWLDLHKKDKAAITKLGGLVGEVAIDVDEFKRFLIAKNARHNLKALERFTNKKACGLKF
jgi:hypothetical protein